MGRSSITTASLGRASRAGRRRCCSASGPAPALTYGLWAAPTVSSCITMARAGRPSSAAQPRRTSSPASGAAPPLTCGPSVTPATQYSTARQRDDPPLRWDLLDENLDPDDTIPHWGLGQLRI